MLARHLCCGVGNGCDDDDSHRAAGDLVHAGGFLFAYWQPVVVCSNHGYCMISRFNIVVGYFEAYHTSKRSYARSVLVYSGAG